MAATIQADYDAKYTNYEMVSVEDTTPYERWVEAASGARGITKTDEVPTEYFPRHMRFTKGRRLYDFNSYTAFATTISNRLKEAIESIEPGVHQFVPVQVMHVDGTSYGEKFWYFVIRSEIDAIAPEKGGVHKAGWGKNPDLNYHWVIEPEGYAKLAVYKDRIKGRAMWRDARYPGEFFISDALLKLMRESGMEGWSIGTSWKEK